jgi:6-pyruvoyltetrahydropterin/6-carboxytetrahydropterin synthase
MYSVTKRIDFCYGHRLLDYDGICKHPHGHNAVAEVEVRTGTLDNRNMVCDFSDIKRVVKGWIDRELDHKMILRHDDPLVKPLQQLGEPIFIVDSNPTVERIAKLIFDQATEHGLPVVRVTVWETPTSFADYRAESPSPRVPKSPSPLVPCAITATASSSSISTARSSIRGATSPTPQTRCSRRTARRRSTRSASAAWSATALRRWWHGRSPRTDSSRRPTR